MTYTSAAESVTIADRAHVLCYDCGKRVVGAAVRETRDNASSRTVLHHHLKCWKLRKDDELAQRWQTAEREATR